MVTVVGKELAVSLSKSSEQQAMFCLVQTSPAVVKQTKSTSEYISLLNQSIVGEVDLVVRPSKIY